MTIKGAAKKQNQWKPIDTAPKDGTYVLVYNNDGYVYDANYDGGKWRFASADQHGCGCCSGDYDRPTHWMPLPDKPEEVSHDPT